MFYGWRIVALGFLNNAMSAGVGTYAFSVFVKPMTEDAGLGWSRTELVLGMTLSITLASLSGPLLGAWLDRKHGARILMVFMGLTGGSALALLSQAHHLWQYYLLFGVVAALFHHVPTGLVVPTIVSKWFIRHRGQALAFSSMGISAAGMVLIPVVAVLISSIGWRMSWVVLGAATIVMVVPPNALWMRRRPEDMGLRPYGEEVDLSPGSFSTAGRQAQAPSEVQWTARSAIRTAPFWLILLSGNLALTGLMGILINQVAYLEDQVDSGIAIAGATLMTVFILVGKPPWVFVANRIGVVPATAATHLFSAAGLVFLVTLSHPSFVFIWAVAFGLGIAGLDPLISLLWANLFGRHFLGSIRGVYLLSNVISMAGAPLFAAFIFETTGSYEPAFLLFLASFTLAAVLMLFTRKPALPQARPDNLLP